MDKTSLLKNLRNNKGNALWINAVISRFDQPKLEILRNIIELYKIALNDEIQRFEMAF